MWCALGSHNATKGLTPLLGLCALHKPLPAGCLFQSARPVIPCCALDSSDDTGIVGAQQRRDYAMRTTPVTCAHTEWTVTDTHGFAGPVSADENRAAHGNVCNTERCCRCGAERRTNVNQWHREEGRWGPTLADRRAAATAARRAAREALRLVRPITLVSASSGQRVTLRLDGEGMLCGDALPGVVASAASSQPEWLAAAQAARRAVVAAESAERGAGVRS